MLAIVRVQLDEAAFAAAWAPGHAMSLEEAAAFALTDPELTHESDSLPTNALPSSPQGLFTPNDSS